MIEKKCLICGAVFYVKPCRLNTAFFCSKVCFYKSLSKKHTGTGNPFYGKKHSDDTRNKMIENHADFNREKSSNWKGGRNKQPHGYIFVLDRDHPFAMKNGRVQEHRIVAEKCLNRYLTEEEVVHHINEIRDDNRLENLYLFVNVSEHTSHHNSKPIIELSSNIIEGV